MPKAIETIQPSSFKRQMSERQWPDNICSGQIRYGESNIPGSFYLADVEHGIPTFGSVSDAMYGQRVHIFNYPDQTEQIAAQLVHRWNSHDALVKALEEIQHRVNGKLPVGRSTLLNQIADIAAAALASLARGGE